MERAAWPLRDEADQPPARLFRQRGVHQPIPKGFFSRMRRAEIGHHHHIAGCYLARYAQESAWREDHRRDGTASRSSGRPPRDEEQAERRFLRVLAAIETSSGGIGAAYKIADMAGQSDSVDFRDVIDAGPSGVTPSTLDLIQSLPTPVLMSLIARPSYREGQDLPVILNNYGEPPC